MPLIRSASYNLFVEILIRIFLILLFCYMETMQPFTRVVHKAELESDYMYPRRDSFVPSGILWTIVLGAPCLISVLAWLGCNDCNDAFEVLLAWSLGLGMNGVFTDMVKLIVGRPRPDFFYRCFPDGVETEDLQCTGNAKDVMDGRKSFPSGHSSLSFCSLGMFSLWLCGRLGVLSRRRGSAARVLACAAPLAVATCIALSRTCDYHHHWQDVLAGSILGFTIGIFCYRQYYNPLTSDLAGLPYIVGCVQTAKYANGKPTESPLKIPKEESTSLLTEKKVDKWI